MENSDGYDGRWEVEIYTRYGTTHYTGSFASIKELREVAINAGHGVSGMSKIS